ncbi:MAG: ribonuclease R [Muribaculaceae bacterium]
MKKNNKDIAQKITAYINTLGNVTYNYRQVSAGIDAKTPAMQRKVAMKLAEMAFDGEIIEVAPGKYKNPQRGTIALGTFIRRANGKNSVLIDDDDEAIFVAERNSMHALNGDRVKVNIAAHRRGAEPEAEVIEIVEKKEQVFIGTLRVAKTYAILLTDSKFLATDIIIPKQKLKGGENGDKAVVKITQWSNDSKNPIGEVIDILGKTGENTTEMHAILAEYGLPYKYPENVDKAAQKIDAGITPEEIAKRRDMRDVTTFTIDPKDAKDFDDALSFRILENGNYEVGVHIADVTHYVTPGSIIEKEAEARATSIYLVDRTIPMLPEHLSNGICSLRPDEEKLTYSCIFEMTATGRVVKSEIAKTVIKSNRRLTYEEAQEIIENGRKDVPCGNEILILDSLAKILRKERYENGSVEFDRVEVRFEIDDKGHPTSVYFKESKDANKLIEEFMLLANKTVAQTIGKVPGKKKAKAFVYRIHDKPDEVKLSDLAALSRTFGYKVKTTGSTREVNKSLNRMLVDVKGKGEENLLSTLAIRSMAKAVYSTVNIGHYGLGFEYYTHFTSPIRRYPDMMVHRLLEKYLDGGRSVNAARLEDECKHSSDMEQLAATAERASIKYKQVEYLQDHLGESYTGIISGVTEWGFFVELDDNKCEGLVPMRSLADDYYDFDDKNYCLIGRRSGIRFTLGDKVTVSIARADLDKKQLDFALEDPRLARTGEDQLGIINPFAKPQKKSKTKIDAKKSTKKSSNSKVVSKKSKVKRR